VTTYQRGCYRVLPDEAATGEGLVRIIDDSGEDYLYPASRFVVVQVPQSEEQKLLSVASANAFDASMGPTRPDASLAVTPKAQKDRLGP
jgi:hypothetical protein